MRSRSIGQIVTRRNLAKRLKTRPTCNLSLLEYRHNQQSPLETRLTRIQAPCDGRVVVDFRIVAQFVIERELPGAGALSDTQIREISLRSLQALKDVGPQIQWLHSYVTEDKVYCVYLAPDEDTVREHARRAGIPADRISAVRRLIDPANLN